MSLLTLRNGVRMPMVGFGTAFFRKGLCRPELAYRNVRKALDAGYTHIDTAHMYGCEPHIGKVLAQDFTHGTLERDDIFLTTKSGHPPTSDFVNGKTQWLYDTKLSAYDGVLSEFYQSLRDLGVGYVDLFLLHWPGMFDFPDRFPKNFSYTVPSAEVALEKRMDMWRACEYLYNTGLTRSVGVSNFLPQHLEPIISEFDTAPMMNQFEIHPYLQQNHLVEFCHKHGIEVTAYCPLGSGALNLLEDPLIVDLASKQNVSPGKYVLTWLVQRRIAVIPKSSNLERMKSNLLVTDFQLSEEEMQAMATLDKCARVCADASTIL